MRQVLTERQQRFADLAAGLADRFAGRAAEHDRAATFPVADFDDMRTAGFLRLTVPEELGGFGASLAELLPALERLAAGNGATALAATMHLSPLGQWSAVWRRTGSPSLEAMLSRAGRDELLWAALTAEAGLPNRMADARTTATRVPGGYRLTGRKIFGTNSAVATHCSTTARHDDPALGPRLLLFRVDLSDPAITVHRTWDVLGMRATRSDDVEYRDLFLPDDALVHALPVGHHDARLLETVFAWAMPAFGAVYTGIARRALTWVVDRVRDRGRTGDPSVVAPIAEAELLLEQSRAMYTRHADEVGAGTAFAGGSVQEGMARCAAVKHACTENAIRAVDGLVEIAGGSALSRAHPFERLWRDVQAGRVMPFDPPAARELIAASALGVTLAPESTSDLVADEPRLTTAVAADDFGHLVHRTPHAVVRPASADDVAAAVRSAARDGRRIAARGCGHSVFGRSQADDGIVVDMRGLRAVHDVRDDRVVVGAGASWHEVVAATLPLGLTPPVLPDHLGPSVGGTLAVGGVGAGTARFGLVTDNVLEIDVVTGAGETVTCSPTASPDLFDAVRAGLGKVGVVTRATLRLVPAPRRVRRLLLHYPDLTTMLRDQRRLIADGRFDAVQGAVLIGPDGQRTFRLDAVVGVESDPPADAALLAGLDDDRPAAQATTPTFGEYLGRLAPLEQALRAGGQWLLPHPWLTTFVGDAAVESVVGSELARLTPADLGSFGQIALSAMDPRAIATPLVRLPDDDLCFAFNLIRIPEPGSPADADRLVAANRAIHDRIRTSGGTLYPVSAFPMSGADWREHFGPVLPRLRDAIRRYDPDDLLTPGYDLALETSTDERSTPCDESSTPPTSRSTA